MRSSPILRPFLPLRRLTSPSVPCQVHTLAMVIFQSFSKSKNEFKATMELLPSITRELPNVLLLDWMAKPEQLKVAAE